MPLQSASRLAAIDWSDDAPVIVDQRRLPDALVEWRLGTVDEVVRALGGRRVAPEAIDVWNPAFDVTPAGLITAFVTDGGVLEPPFGPAIARLVGR